MNLSDVKIRKSFRKTPPKKEKMDACRLYYQQNGCIDRDLVLDRHGFLIDGYVGYLVLLENGVTETDVIVDYTKGRPQKVIYVSAKHNGVEKEYVWKISFEQFRLDPIRPGSKLLVETAYGNRVVIATAVIASNTPPVNTDVKNVLRCLQY